MPRNIKPHALLFRRQHFRGRPDCRLRQVARSVRSGHIFAPKKIVLTTGLCSLCSSRTSQGYIDGREVPRSPLMGGTVIGHYGIECSATDEALQNSFVDSAFFHPFREIKKGSERTSLARLHDGGDAGQTNSLDRCQPVTNRTLQCSKANVAFVNIRRQQNNSLPSHLFCVAKDFRRIVNFIRKYGRIEVFPVVSLEIPC